MKKLLVGLLAIGSISAFAADKFECSYDFTNTDQHLKSLKDREALSNIDPHVDLSQIPLSSYVSTSMYADASVKKATMIVKAESKKAALLKVIKNTRVEHKSSFRTMNGQYVDPTFVNFDLYNGQLKEVLKRTSRLEYPKSLEENVLLLKQTNGSESQNTRLYKEVRRSKVKFIKKLSKESGISIDYLMRGVESQESFINKLNQTSVDMENYINCSQI